MRWVAAGPAPAVAGLLLAVPGVFGMLPNAATYVLYAGAVCPPADVQWRCCGTGCGTWTAWCPHLHLRDGHHPAGAALSVC
jgi:hypothetical protein